MANLLFLQSAPFAARDTDPCYWLRVAQDEEPFLHAP